MSGFLNTTIVLLHLLLQMSDLRLPLRDHPKFSRLALS